MPGTPPTFTGGPTTTPAIPPGRTCLVTANYPYVEDPSVIPPVVTQCQGEIDVEVGGCDYQNKEFELEISNHGIGDPHWLPGQGIVQADPRITWVTTDDSGYATVRLAVGDKTPTGTTLEIIARAKPDASGNYAWTCPRNTQDTFVVDNKCVNFRAYYKTALGIVDMQDAGRYCASVLKELFFEIEHCKDDLAPLGNPLRVEVYDQLGQLFDKEDVVLEPIGTATPVKGFIGSISPRPTP